MNNIINDIKGAFLRKRTALAVRIAPNTQALDDYRVRLDKELIEMHALRVRRYGYDDMTTESRNDTPIYDRLEREWMDCGFGGVVHAW